MKIMNIVGARPNFVKIAPLVDQMQKTDGVVPFLLHTGQHYDENMSRVFFDQLEIPKPDVDLEVGSGSNAVQVGEIMKRFEPVLIREKPDFVLVVGDVNSTLACSLVASYHRVPVIHVEAGLRSFDRTMPEEINRVLTDQLSELLFATEESALDNLTREGVDPKKIHLVGNVMVDTLLNTRARTKGQSAILKTLGLAPRSYALITLHRPSNVDAARSLTDILEAVNELARDLPVVFAIHPRTQKRIEEFQLSPLTKSLIALPPQPYVDMLELMASAKMVLTDSGGMQEETTILGVPCLTLRENTERPVTLNTGTSVLVGNDKNKILQEARLVLDNRGKKGSTPPHWDGRAAERIVKTIVDWHPDPA